MKIFSYILIFPAFIVLILMVTVSWGMNPIFKIDNETYIKKISGSFDVNTDYENYYVIVSDAKKNSIQAFCNPYTLGDECLSGSNPITQGDCNVSCTLMYVTLKKGLGDEINIIINAYGDDWKFFHEKNRYDYLNSIAINHLLITMAQTCIFVILFIFFTHQAVSQTRRISADEEKQKNLI